MTTGRGPGARGSRRALHVVGPDGAERPASVSGAEPGSDTGPGSGSEVTPPGEAPATAPPTSPSTTPPPGSSPHRPRPTGGRTSAERHGGAPQPDWERSREHAECFVAEDEVLADARARSADRGVTPVGAGAGTALTFLAASTGARAVVEIGTGLGVGTICLLRGMPADGLLTSIDVDSEHQRLARRACLEAGFAPGRVRTITGRALEVLPRLSDGAYDLVLVDAATVEYPRYLAEAVRLLRRGGVVVLDNALWNGRVADPVRRDAITVALRETGRAVREDERLVPVMLPLSDGLLCAALR